MMRALTLNILFGGKLDPLCALLRDLRPDLVVLQECLSWGEPEVMRVADALELPRQQVLLATARPRGSGNRFHLVVASRLPWVSAKVHADPHFIGHCIAECRLLYQGQPLTVFGAHFDSHHENLRFVEARYLRSLISTDGFSKNHYLLMGDLNSLSSRDPYPQDLAEKVKQAGTDKYGHPPRFEVIEDIERFGWLDTLYQNGTPKEWVTAERNRGGVSINYRTDYIFSSPSLAPRLQNIEIINTTGLSDHHGLLAKFA